MDDFLKRYRVRSTLILITATWMLIRVAEWSMWFAVGNLRNGMEIAAILAAIQVPATLYAGYAFKVFQESKTI